MWVLILSINWKLNENGHFEMLNVGKNSIEFWPFSSHALFYVRCDFYGQRTLVFISIWFLHIRPKSTYLLSFIYIINNQQMYSFDENDSSC